MRCRVKIMSMRQVTTFLNTEATRETAADIKLSKDANSVLIPRTKKTFTGQCIRAVKWLMAIQENTQPA